MNHIMKVKNITKNFAGKRAVDNVSFEVSRGEILGLLGPNGAGKTTIIRMILDIIAPDSGEIGFNGFSREDKKMFGYLPEERGIYRDSGVLDTIMYFADLNGMSRKESREKGLNWLKKLKLEKYSDKKIEELSKGMQQKIQFIISVIHSPKLLIVDEIFSGLDPVNQDLFKDVIEEIAESGTSILLSSHRMNLVEELCDRIFLINQGERVLYGELDKIKAGYGKKKVMLKTAKRNYRYLKNNSDINGFDEDKDGISFYIDSNRNIISFLNNLSKNLEIKEVSIQSPDLHDIFVNTVKGVEVNE